MDHDDVATRTKNRTRKDKADRATVDGVLDNRTRVRIQKLLTAHLSEEQREAGLSASLEGSISRGKEANVFLVKLPDEKYVCVKVYNTSILVFKDREVYVTGEHRFASSGYTKNPRTMVEMWCNKEMRNLLRLRRANLPVPQAFDVKKNVLLMELIPAHPIENPSTAALRLKDITWKCSTDSTKSPLVKAWLKTFRFVFLMYNAAGLVHGDLSEYNMLYGKDAKGRGEVYVIDVSQSVELDHNQAFDFLRRDIKNVTRYFQAQGVITPSSRAVFECITDPSHMVQTSPPSNKASYDEETLAKKEAAWQDAVGALHVKSSKLAVSMWQETNDAVRAGTYALDEVEEAVFMQQFIPRVLDDITDTGRQRRAMLAMLRAADDGEDSEGDDDEENDEDDGSCDSAESSDSDGAGGRHRDESVPDEEARYKRKDMTKEEWKAAKKAIKEERAEKRKDKVAKKDKKRAKTLSMRNRGK
ncbi:RIO1 family [Carpediemonas membranifera]|uniref:non-specific serine/threonine protein kinase n=1 Tax=Carpediemonas membranifera TaxID=201153 RepID=A0A8J6E8X5_9EUKA|nr:RIO1 family [Carpediemonas membranifera]|eukprot:KAG9392530.1 RIO1 family [Carpediemonas membranifera]